VSAGERVGDRGPGIVARAAAVLRLTEGQLYTAVIGLVTAAVLIAVTLPAVLDSREAAGRAEDLPATSGTPTPPAPDTSGPLGASDQGVTAETIKVGVVLLDLSSVEPLGLGLDNYEIKLQQAAFDSYFAAVNDAGGVNGRRIEPVYASRDSLAQSGPHSDAAICIKMAKDEKVFALIGYNYAAGPCASIQHGIPSVQQQGAREQEYDASGNFIVSSFPSPERTGRNWARVLVETGLVEDHEVALVSIGDGDLENLGGLAAEEKLAELGHPVESHVQFSASASTNDVKVAVRNMMDAGVDQVMFAAPFIVAIQFMTFAEEQKFYPTYLTSDLGALASDGLLREAPPSFDGAIGFTASDVAPEGAEEPVASQECREEFNAATDGKDLAVGEESPLTTICAVVDMFVQAAMAAGTDLTRQGLIEALQGLEVTGVPGVLPGSFAEGKTDFADGLRPVRYSVECDCYSPAGDPIPLPPQDD